MDFQGFSLIFQGFFIDSGSDRLSRVGGRWSLERSERSSRGGGIGARGRRRRPRAQKYISNDASVVPTDLYGDWRSLDRFLENFPKPILCKKNVPLRGRQDVFVEY